MKKLIAFTLTFALSTLAITGCSDSSQTSNTVKNDYDADAVVAKYMDGLDDIPDADKDYVIQMGYNDCDHMVAAIIGQDSGLYQALGLNVEITKTSKVSSAMASGDIVVGYAGFGGMISTVNSGANVIMPAGSHLGGSRYLVVSNDIETIEDMIGTAGTTTEESMYSTTWLCYVEDDDIYGDYTLYDGYSMSQPDAMTALASGSLSFFTCCDPYASIIESRGLGKIVGTEWGCTSEEDGTMNWGLHCGYYLNADFAEAHPELATRLVLAHCLAIQYMYLHPYNAAMMFADTFGVEPEVGLRTMYLKLCAEGRTLSYSIDQTNIENFYAYQDHFNLPEDYKNVVNDIESFFDLTYYEACGIEPFEEFIEANNIDEKFPVKEDYLTWLEDAETIDGIDHSSTVGKEVEKWNNGEIVTNLPHEDGYETIDVYQLAAERLEARSTKQ